MVVGSINSIICTNDCNENKSKEVRRKFQFIGETNSKLQINVELAKKASCEMYITKDIELPTNS